MLFLSEGMPGVDDTFSICSGKLRMVLGKERYERSGLQGRVIKGGGRKHVGVWWEVVVDLRGSGMVRGKKGFERLVRASREVLGEGRSWVVVDVEGEGKVRDVLGREGCVWVEVEAVERDVDGMRVPEGVERVGGGDEEGWWDVGEWLDLMALGSQRVNSLRGLNGSSSDTANTNEVAVQDLKVISWGGLMSSQWVTQLMIEIIKQSRVAKTDSWLAVKAMSHRTDAVGQIDGCTILLQPEVERQEMIPYEDGRQMETSENAGEKEKQSPAGLQRCTCLQYVDSVVS